MIVSNITNSKKEKEIIFPCLMECYINNKLVVFLMFEPDEGTIVYSDHPEYVIGEYNSDWNIKDLELFNDTIILSNE